LFVAVLLGTCAAVLAEAVRVLTRGNTHEVVPGRVYRSAQLSATQLREFIRSRGIRTVVNLRGCCSDFDWYTEECRATHELNVAQEDVTLSAQRLPAPSELRRLIEVLDRAEYPIVLHCRQGADRTGLAAGIYLLLHTDADLPTARRQCSPRYAHFAVLATAAMDRFFDMYDDWLKQRGTTHAPDLFRIWTATDYRPDPAPARIELLGDVPAIQVDEAVTLHVRVTNLSHRTWDFKPGTLTGIHARYVVFEENGAVRDLLRAGRFAAQVPPGESIDLDLPLPPLHRPGVHRVLIDMAEGNVNFSQLGSEFVEVEVNVRGHQGR
jgi:hypothetical protein